VEWQGGYVLARSGVAGVLQSKKTHFTFTLHHHKSSLVTQLRPEYHFLSTHVIGSLLSSQVVQLGALLSEDLGLSLSMLSGRLVLLLSAPQLGLDSVVSLLLLQELLVSLVVDLKSLGLVLLGLEFLL